MKLKNFHCVKDLNVKIKPEVLKQCNEVANDTNKMQCPTMQHITKLKDVHIGLPYWSLLSTTNLMMRCSCLNMFFLEKCHLQGKLIRYFKILSWFTYVDKSTKSMIEDLFQAWNNNRKLKFKQINSECTSFFFFSNTVTREWNKPPPLVVQYCTNNLFKKGLTFTSFN